MIDLTFLSGAIGSTQAAIDLVKSIGAAKTAGEVNAATAELNNTILSLQGQLTQAFAAHVTVMKENEQLKELLSKIEDFKTDAQRYKLSQPWGGAIVYALKESMSQGEPPHYLCTQCYQSHKKSIMQNSTSKMRLTNFECPACKATVPTKYNGQVAATYAPEDPT